MQNQYSRTQLLLGAEAMEKLHNSRVAVFGIGGVCPFGINDGVTVYLDESLKRFGTVFPACGSSNSAIELTIPELEKYSNFVEWIDVCKI